MRAVAIMTMLIALTGCTSPSGRPVCLLGVNVSLQIGGNHTHPTIETYNAVSDSATQTHELPISHNVDAATDLDTSLK